MGPQDGDWPDKKDSGKGVQMDLKTLLANVENKDDLIRQIESEIGKEYVPRAEFNNKNQELKDRDKQLGDLKNSHDDLSKKAADYDKTIAELTSKVTTYEMSSLKARIAREKGIPYELAGRLTGEDEKALREDAEALSKLIVKGQPAPPLKSTEPDGDGDNSAYKSLLSSIKGE